MGHVLFVPLFYTSAAQGLGRLAVLPNTTELVRQLGFSPRLALALPAASPWVWKGGLSDPVVCRVTVGCLWPPALPHGTWHGPGMTYLCWARQSMRVKLQPASSTKLPAFSPLVPPAVISQVLLLDNPHKVRSGVRPTSGSWAQLWGGSLVARQGGWRPGLTSPVVGSAGGLSPC